MPASHLKGEIMFSKRCLAPIVAAALVSNWPLAAAHAQWSSDTTTNLSIGDGPGEQAMPKIAPTSDGGCYVSWYSTFPSGYDVRMQRLNSRGEAQWTHNGILIADRATSAVSDYVMVTDGVYAYIGFTDDRVTPNQVTVQKVDPAGNLLWNGAVGVNLGAGNMIGSPPSLAMLSDGGIGVIWNGTIAPTRTQIQKVDANGVPQWTTISQGDPIAATPFQASDVQAGDNGGLIVLFVRCGGSNCVTSAKHLYAQKYNNAGLPQWGGGLPIAIYTASGLTTGYFPRFLPDGAGGAVFGWYEGGLNRDAFIQHILSDGTPKFASPVANTGSTPGRIRVGAGLAYDAVNEEYYLASNETNSGTQSQDRVFVQKYDSEGIRLWGDTGVTLLPTTTTSQPSFVQAQLMGDGVAVYYMKTTAATTRVIAAAHVDAEQTVVWDVLAASNGGEDKSRLASAISTCGYHILAFGNGSAGSSDARVQNVRTDGTFGNPPPLLGDLDCDGTVDVPDINPFIQAVLSPAGYAFLHPCCDINNANMNGDAEIDGLDIADFVTALMNP